MSQQSVLQRIAGFRPDHLLRVETEVRVVHPRTGDSDLIAGPDVLERLRRLFKSTSEADLEELARSLSPADMRAVLQLLCLNEEKPILDRAVRVTQYRPRRDLVLPAWRLLLTHYPVGYLEQVFRFLVSKYRYPWIQADEAMAKAMDGWLLADSIPKGILQDIEDSPYADIDAFLTDAGIPEGTSLRAAVWREILGDASVELIVRIGPNALMKRAQAEPAVIQQRFAANYLCRLRQRSAWNNQVLSWIREKYGVPPLGEIQTPFWRRITEEIRREFRRWANEATIREFFEKIYDPHGRFRFWRGFIDEVEEVCVVAGNQAMLMDFGHFGVVEFSQIGNAAYIYKAENFVRIRQTSSDASPAAFKNQLAAYKRIIHREGWEQEWRWTIKDLLRG